MEASLCARCGTPLIGLWVVTPQDPGRICLACHTGHTDNMNKVESLLAELKDLDECRAKVVEKLVAERKRLAAAMTEIDAAVSADRTCRHEVDGDSVRVVRDGKTVTIMMGVTFPAKCVACGEMISHQGGADPAFGS